MKSIFDKIDKLPLSTIRLIDEMAEYARAEADDFHPRDYSAGAHHGINLIQAMTQATKVRRNISRRLP